MCVGWCSIIGLVLELFIVYVNTIAHCFVGPAPCTITAQKMDMDMNKLYKNCRFMGKRKLLSIVIESYKATENRYNVD
jgi:hypothetical protein